MTLWLILGAMAALALALLLPPVLRREGRAEDRAAYDAQVYRDQLAEIARDRERGVVDEADAEAARIEVARRLLAADAAAGGGRAEGDAPQVRTGGGGAAAAAIAAPLAAIALYLSLGSPGLPGRPAAERAAERAQPGRPAGDMTAMVNQLGEKLRARPNDREGWSLYAHALSRLGRFDEAIAAWKKAVSLDPGNADWVSQLAEVQISAANGMVTPAALASLETTLRLDPAEPRARYYRGLAALQAGDADGALKRWLALEAESPVGAPWRKILADRIERLAGERKIDAGQLAALRADAAKNAPATAAPRGPTAADMKAAQQMAPDDRQAMIRGMVERLAARLKENPDDLAGWQRLERAWRVLGETAKADEAAARVKVLQAGGAAATTAAPPRGPTAADVRAAQEMAPDDRQAMIRGMVERLAARLKENPDDLAGWRRLERAWRVLGETAKADEAAARVTALRGQQSATPPAAPPPGPTADDVKAAQQMSPEDRQAMIRGMVARLAERLKTEPNDAEGWVRLGRSYRALGDLKQARAAYAKATALKPDDSDVLIDYIDTIIRTADPNAAMPDELASSAVRLLKLRPDHPAGHWFSGVARLQAGDKQGAVDHWKALLTLLDPKGTQHRDLSQRIETLEKDLRK